MALISNSIRTFSVFHVTALQPYTVGRKFLSPFLQIGNKHRGEESPKFPMSFRSVTANL